MTTEASALIERALEANAKARELLIAVQIAEKNLNDVAADSAKKITTAQNAFNKVRDTQGGLNQAASEAHKGAMEALLAYQGQVSNELGIEINVLPPLPGGSTRL